MTLCAKELKNDNHIKNMIKISKLKKEDFIVHIFSDEINTMKKYDLKENEAEEIISNNLKRDGSIDMVNEFMKYLKNDEKIKEILLNIKNKSDFIFAFLDFKKNCPEEFNDLETRKWFLNECLRRFK